MAETIWWCVPYHELRTMSEPCEAGSNHDRPHECRWLVDPATVDYEAAARLLEQKQTVARGRFRLDEADAADIVDAALGLGEPGA
jgi:hypothetical protein